MRLVLAFSVLFACCIPAFAEATTPERGPTAQATLASVNAELETLLADLEANQDRTVDLQARLADLETLSSRHLATLAEQDKQLASYAQTVHQLEAHDETTLAQLAAERLTNAWLLPVAISATVLAALEALLLLAVVSS